MSGTASGADWSAASGAAPAEPARLEVTGCRPANVGSMTVRRMLPGRGRRTVGPWCFLDHLGPATVTEQHGLDIGPHPHIGLQTVTWLLHGEALHRDSLGSEQLIRPGQLNLMTAGHGVAHSEEATGTYRGLLVGAQLWVAQPEATRHGAAAFEHHAELPQVAVGGGVATVLVGELGGAVSPARRDTDHVGIDLEVVPGPSAALLPVDRRHEHAVAVLEGGLSVGGRQLESGQLGYLGPGASELELRCAEPTRALLLGGAPFPEPVLMWWNYVARDRAEITEAHRQWLAADRRFGIVSSPLPRITPGPPPWTAV